MTIQRELAALSDHAWQRFTQRMTGLDDIELMWLPTQDARIGLGWRLWHIAALLGEERNATWLGLPGEGACAPADQPATSARALGDLETSYRWWRSLLDRVDDHALTEPVGAIAGPYGESTRMAFVLHVLDELVHHTAEAALLRDLYEHQSAWPGPAVPDSKSP